MSKGYEWGHVAEPYWEGKPVAIIGNGPSTRGLAVDRLRGRFHVLAVKAAIFDIPWADAGFGLDFPRYQEWHRRLFGVTFPVYWGIVNFTYIPTPTPDHVFFLHRIDRPAGLSDDPSFVNAGGTSGFGAFNLAWLKRARRVYLFGFDYHPDKKGAWHADETHYQVARGQTPGLWEAWAKHWATVAPKIKAAGVEVINVSPTSLITAFPKISIEEALDGEASRADAA